MNFQQILILIVAALFLSWFTGYWNPTTSPSAIAPSGGVAPQPVGIAPQSVGIAPFSASGCAQVTVPLLNVRTSPNGQVLTRLRAGERVQLTGINQSGWNQIQRPNGRAWVFGQYLRSSGC